MQNENINDSINKTKLIAISALLSAMGILIALVMPKIIIVPSVMSVTPASHVPLMLAMFIHPFSAVAVTLITTLGFMLSLGPVVALRALSHIFFALTGSFLAKKLLTSLPRTVFFNIIVALIHAVAEGLVVFVCMFIFKDYFPNIENVAFYIFVLVGLVTIAHSTVDFILAYLVYVPLKKHHLIN